jgi:hypothetical protein
LSENVRLHEPLLGGNPKKMLWRHPKQATGSGNLQFIVTAAILVTACYVGFSMGKPYLAYRSLERTMEQWAKISLYKGDRRYSDLKEKIQWTIDRHNIPLDIQDVEIVYDPEEKMLSVYAEYDVYVTFPGYEYHYFFQPYVEVYAQDD